MCKEVTLQIGLGYKSINNFFDFKYGESTYLTQKFDTTTKISTKYLQVLLEVAYELPISRSMSAKFGAGITYKYLVKGDDDYEYAYADNILATPTYTKSIFAPNFRIGLVKSFSKSAISLDVVYERDISKMSDNGSYGFYGNIANARNRSLGISLSYAYNLGKLTFRKQSTPAK